MTLLRPLSLVVVIFGLIVSSANAAGWHHFASKQMRLSVRYPGGWMVAQTSVPGAYRVQFGQKGGQLGLTVQMPPIRSTNNILNTARQFALYQQRTGGDPAYAQIRWKRGRVAGLAAAVGVTKPAQTEGGLALNRGVEIVQRGKRVYEIEFTAYHSPGYSRISQFPAVYRQILATLKFS